MKKPTQGCLTLIPYFSLLGQQIYLYRITRMLLHVFYSSTLKHFKVQSYLSRETNFNNVKEAINILFYFFPFSPVSPLSPSSPDLQVQNSSILQRCDQCQQQPWLHFIFLCPLKIFASWWEDKAESFLNSFGILLAVRESCLDTSNCFC